MLTKTLLTLMPWFVVMAETGKWAKTPLVPVNFVGRRRGWSVADMANDYYQ